MGNCNRCKTNSVVTAVEFNFPNIIGSATMLRAQMGVEFVKCDQERLLGNMQRLFKGEGKAWLRELGKVSNSSLSSSNTVERQNALQFVRTKSVLQNIRLNCEWS